MLSQKYIANKYASILWLNNRSTKELDTKIGNSREYLKFLRNVWQTVSLNVSRLNKGLSFYLTSLIILLMQLLSVLQVFLLSKVHFGKFPTFSKEELCSGRLGLFLNVLTFWYGSYKTLRHRSTINQKKLPNFAQD